MKNTFFFTLFLFCFFSLNSQIDTSNVPIWQSMMQDRNVNYFKTLSAYKKYYANRKKERHTGYKAFERWAYYWSQRILSDGSFPPPMRTHNEYFKFLRNQVRTRSASGNWKPIGPFNSPNNPITGAGVGRVNALYVHPSNGNYLAGAPQGGLWTSTNQGLTWTSNTDYLPSLGVSAIVVHPTSNPEKIFIGTGDRDANDADGKGVWVSNDNGQTFVASNTGMGDKIVNKLMLNPVNPNHLVAACSDGVYFSYNQGANWIKRTTFNASYKDIQYAPGDTATLYVTTFSSAFGTSRFYRTTNGGASWNEITTGLSSVQKNRMAIGVTPANPNIVYLVASEASDNTLEAFYKSSNKGASFQMQQNTFNILGGDVNGGTRGQGWYDLAIETSPTDSNWVMVGGINIFSSSNGGVNWTCKASWWGQNGVPLVHADIHVFYRDPASGRLLVGHDGGFTFTDNNGNSWTDRNNGMTISQIYRIGYSPLDSNKLIAGFQDNGTSVFSVNSWSNEVGGDGMECEISPFNTSHMLGCVQNGVLQRTTNNGTNWTSIADVITEDDRPWVSPYQIHPRVNNHFTLGFKRIYTSNNLFTSTQPTYITADTFTNSDATDVRYSNVSNNIVYVGFANGTVKRSNNILSNNPTFVTLTPPGGSSRVTSIETSHRDSNVVYITKSDNFSNNKVYRSSNMGATWVDYTANLPNIPFLSLVIDKHSFNGVYVGTDAGVYYRDSLMSNWILYNAGLPVTSAITDLEIWYDSLVSARNVIMASTYGRGVWKSDLRITETQPVININIPNEVCQGTTLQFQNNTIADSFRWRITPSTGVVFANGTKFNDSDPQVTFNNTGTYTISLFAYKYGNGYNFKTQTINVGINGNLSVTKDTIFTCPGDTQALQASGAINYNWSPATDLLTTTGNNVKTVTNQTRVYTVISDMGNGACKDTATVTVILKPTVNLSVQGNRKLCQGDTSTIVVNGADSFLWTPSTSLSSDTARSVRCFTNSDITYNIKGSSAGLCSNSINFSINSQTRPIFTYSKNPDTFLCSNVSFEMEYQGNLSSYLIVPETGLTRNGDNLKFDNSTTQKYVLSFQDTQFCPIFDTFTIQRKVKPNVVVSGIKSLCVGDSTVLSASGADTFVWKPATFLDKNFGNTVRTKPSATIEYTVVGKIESCIDSTKHTITVGTQNVNLIISGDSFLCENNRTRLVASGALNYSWSPAQFVDNPNSASVFVKSQNPVTLTVTGTTFGCVGQASKSLVLGQTPEIQYTIEKGALQICKGDTVQIKLNPELKYDIEPLYNYKYVNDSQFIFFPRDITKYTIYAKGSNSCINSDDIEILVENRPTVTINPGPTTIFRGDSIYLLAEGAVSYFWKSSLAPIKNPNVQGFWAKPNNTTVYQVEGTTAFGCKSDASTVIYVVRNTNPTNGIDDILSQIQFYPNPVQNQLQIESSETLQFVLRTIEGRDLIKSNINKGKNNIDFTNIAQGIYIAWFIKDQENFKIEKINVIK